MDRLHKKPYMLTEIAFILECKDTYILIQMTSKVIGPYMLNTSTQFRRSGLVSQDQISAQIFGLPSHLLPTITSFQY